MDTFVDKMVNIGLEQGIEQGMKRGLEEKSKQIFYYMFDSNCSPEEVSDLTGQPVEYVRSLHEEYVEMVHEDTAYDSGEKKKDE